jgi:mevalonate kinase
MIDMKEERKVGKEDLNAQDSFIGVASAPGKVILFGEHAVVYGQQCMAATCDKYTFGLVVDSRNSSRNGSSEESHMSLEFLDIGLSYDCHRETTTTDNQAKALEAFLTLAKYLGVSSGHFVIKSEIPVGAGLGSSASFSVVVASLLLLVVAQKDKNRKIDGLSILCDVPSKRSSDSTIVNNTKIINKNNKSTKLQINLELVNSLAFMAEKVIHGQPSGVDNTLCTYGGAKIYQKDPATQAVSLEDLDGYDIVISSASFESYSSTFFTISIHLDSLNSSPLFSSSTPTFQKTPSFKFPSTAKNLIKFHKSCNPLHKQ